MIKKIVILGPESTGKSTLSAQLAGHYNTIWVKEYAREYLETNGANYTFDDLLDIAKGQIALEEQGIADAETQLSKKGAAAGFVFIDTNMYVLKVWSEFVFGKCHPWILQQIAERRYDLYLLCDIDLPWVKDKLREYPDLATREKLYDIYKGMMLNQTAAWVNINGQNEGRLQNAIDAVDNIL